MAGMPPAGPPPPPPFALRNELGVVLPPVATPSGPRYEVQGPPWPGVPSPGTSGLDVPRGTKENATYTYKLHKRRKSCLDNFDLLAGKITDQMRTSSSFNLSLDQLQRCFDDRLWFQRYPAYCGKWPDVSHLEQTRKILQMYYTLKFFQINRVRANELEIEHNNNFPFGSFNIYQRAKPAVPAVPAGPAGPAVAAIPARPRTLLGHVSHVGFRNAANADNAVLENRNNWYKGARAADDGPAYAAGKAAYLAAKAKGLREHQAQLEGYKAGDIVSAPLINAAVPATNMIDVNQEYKPFGTISRAGFTKACRGVPPEWPNYRVVMDPSGNVGRSILSPSPSPAPPVLPAGFPLGGGKRKQTRRAKKVRKSKTRSRK